MITKIIACADIHVPSLKKIDSVKDVLKNFIEQCTEIVSENGADSTRIVVAGDIFENKISITNESILAVDWFFKELDKLCKTYIIAGNHDLLVNNMDRVDSLSPLFEIGNYKQVYYLDKMFDFHSGCLTDDNIVWCLYSIFDAYKKPSIESEKIKNEGKEGMKYVGIIHADVDGAISTTNYTCDNGIKPEVFNNLDIVIAGHIHKFQEVRQNGIPCVYCSSINQKNYGESITEHGFVLWELNEDGEFEYNLHEVDNSNYGYYKFEISDISDIENDEEELINL